jgi:hypothetical protein
MFVCLLPSGGKAIPTSQAFWDYLMSSSKDWGMAVYEQVRAGQKKKNKKQTNDKATTYQKNMLLCLSSFDSTLG